MSLENEIKNLTAAVIALTERIEKLEVAPSTEKAPETKEVVKDEPKDEKPKAVEVSEAVDTITAESLQSLCMTIVRADRSKGASIKEIIAGFNGAKTIQQVNPDNYPVLKEALEGLINE